MTIQQDILYQSPEGETAVPNIGQAVPRRGGRFAKNFARLTMRLFGWRVEGVLPNDGKLLIIGAPHTSNWDWVLVMLTAYSLGVRISWMAKHTLFKKPFGGLMRWLGGIAIDRRAKHGTVQQAITSFKEKEKLILCITPEGTRSKVREWKQGFYHIAQGADVPVVVAAFDYGRKAVRLGPTFKPSGNLEADLPIIKSFYDGVVPRHPHYSFSQATPQ